MNRFKEKITGDIEFTVLQVEEKTILSKRKQETFEVIELVLRVEELSSQRSEKITTLIFISDEINSAYYKFAVSVNKVYAGTEGLENLIGATGTANLYYVKDYANFSDWVFYQKSEKTKAALDMYALEADIHQDEDSVKASPFIQSSAENYPKNIFSNSAEVTTDDIDWEDI